MVKVYWVDQNPNELNREEIKLVADLRKDNNY